MSRFAPDIAVRVEGVSKRYRIRHGRRRPDTLRDALASLSRRGHAAGEGVDDVWALRDVSFEIPRGQVVGVIGRNGAGKSTLLKILSRITVPTSGRAEIRGRVGSLLEVGTGFHPELTGRENIYLSGALLGMRAGEIRQKFDEIVAFAETDRFLDAPVKHYSSGMYVRLAFSVAAHLQPEVLLIDEVLAVGDIDFQRKCMDMMGRVAGQGRTILVVSHNMATIKALCSQAMLFEGGVLSAVGPVDSLVDRYLSTTPVGAAQRSVSESEHSGQTRQLRIVSARLSHPVGARFAVYWRQPIELELEIDVVEEMTDVIFGAGVRRMDGLAVFTVHHDDDPAQHPWTFKRGRYFVALTLGNELRPGLYKIEVGAARRYLESGHLFTVDVATLEVLDCGADGVAPKSGQPGVVSGIAIWDAPVESSRLA